MPTASHKKTGFIFRQYSYSIISDYQNKTCRGILVRDLNPCYFFPVFMGITEQVEKNLLKQRVCKNINGIFRQAEGDYICLQLEECPMNDR